MGGIAKLPEERTLIKMAAVRYGGAVYAMPAPARHGDVIRAMEKHLPGHLMILSEEQGFVTNKGAFVGRFEAWWLAAAAEQIPRVEPTPVPRELFTEDLW